jgi:hypothetical protein
MRTVRRVRFTLLTVFGAGVVALLGGMFIYLAVHAWQVGELRMRFGRVIHLSTNPVEFVFMTMLAGVIGLALLGYAPLVLFKAIASSDEQSRFASANPYFYGKVRPSLFWSLLVLLAFVAFALLKNHSA